MIKLYLNWLPVNEGVILMLLMKNKIECEEIVKKWGNLGYNQGELWELKRNY